MKLSILLTALVLAFASLTSFAQVPIELPFTVGPDNLSLGFIDMDEEGDVKLSEFAIELYGDIMPRGNGGMISRMYEIQINIVPVVESGEVVVEIETFVFEDEKGTDEIMMGHPEEFFTTIFNQGDLISSSEDFYGQAIIAGWNDIDVDVKSDSFKDGQRHGFIGCRFYIESQPSMPTDTKLTMPPYYGWIEVLIDDEDQSVTVLSKGMAADPGQDIMAGDAPVIPIPILASILGFGIIGLAAMRKRIKK